MRNLSAFEPRVTAQYAKEQLYKGMGIGAIAMALLTWIF